MLRNKFLSVTGLFLALLVIQPSVARAEYSSGNPWSGLYNTGGYNLLGFGDSLYQTSQYMSSYGGGYGGNSYGGGYGGDSWGGGCGSFMGSAIRSLATPMICSAKPIWR